jgi:hypothetical protein
MLTIKLKPPVAGRVRHRTPKRIEQSVFRMMVEMMYELEGAEQCMKASIAAIPRAFCAIVSPDAAGAPWHEEGRPWLSRHLQQLRRRTDVLQSKLIIYTPPAKKSPLHGTPVTCIRPETTYYESPSSYLVFTNRSRRQIVNYSLHMKSDDKPVSTFICCRVYHDADKQTTAETFTYDVEMTLTFLFNDSSEYRTTVSLPPFVSEDLWRKQKQDEKYTAYEEHYANLISRTLRTNHL